jgi:hypothetical protein
VETRVAREVERASAGLRCEVERLKARPRRQSDFKQSNVTRAFKAAKKAGINVRIDVALDGKLSIVPVESEDAAKPNPWDEVLDQASTKVRPRLS